MLTLILRRARARQCATVAAAAFAASVAIAPPGAVASDSGDDQPPLTLAAAADLAVTAQPLLEAQRHAVRAAREAAVADAQLPDPILVGGVEDLKLGGPERFTLTGEGETELMLGVRQSFPGGNERKLRGSRGVAEANRMAAELDEQRRGVRRDAALAWLMVWKATRAQRLLEASIAEAGHQREAAEIAYRAGRANQADVLGSRVVEELLQDQFAGAEQDEWHGRNELRRWIGAAAERPITDTLPAWQPPDRAQLLEHLVRHPHLAAQSAAVDVARADVDLARADYVPDWSVSLGYGWRPDLTDMASLQFEIGLPVFRGDRQDRVVESRAAAMQRVQSLRDDWLRKHRAHVELNLADWNRLQDRFRRYDEVILPAAQQQLEAALAAYATGGGTLASVIEARRSLLDIRMQRLDLELDAARHSIELQYFASQGEPS